MSGRETNSPPWAEQCPSRILGTFGRGWAAQNIDVRMTSPDIVPLIAYAEAWTPGTNGTIQGKCVRVTIEDKKDFDKYKGTLAGMILIFGPDAEVKTITELPSNV